MEPSQPRVIDRFHQLSKSADLPYLIIGGHAVSALGQPRFTVDIDYAVPAEKISIVRSIMAEIKYNELHFQKAFCQFTPPAPHHPPIDFMLLEDSTWQKLWSERVQIDFGGSEKYPVVGLKHLIAMKAHSLTDPTRAEKDKDLSDIISIATSNNITLKDLEEWGIFSRYNLEAYLEKLRISL